MSSPRPFHRIFGNTWIDFFAGTDVDVETEVDLSIKQQRLDLVIIRKGESPIPWRLPDGFEVWQKYNLVTFKSFQESLDARAMHELVGHYINYLKRVSPSLDDLLPETEFRLFAVCARFPEKLSKQVTLSKVKEAVFEVEGLGLTIRIIVANDLPKEEHNAMLHLFSSSVDLLRYAQEHYQPHSQGTSSLVNQLFEEYAVNPTSLEKLKEFNRQGLERVLKQATPEERLKGISMDELIHALTSEQLEALKRRLLGNSSPPKPE